MAYVEAARAGTYRNNSVTADVVQQGTDNAGRDIYNGPVTIHQTQSLPSSNISLPPSHFVPFRRDPDFIDRGALLDQIRERCAAPASRVALVGLGGVGKSQLAIEHCYRTAGQSQETWVFWAHASNQARLEQSFREIAEQVKVRGREDAQANIFKLVHDWLRNENNRPWLLVLDNADDSAVLAPSLSNSQADDGGNSSSGALQQHLSRYLPPSRHGSVLVTSRTRRAALQLVEAGDIIPIEPMRDTAAHALLHKKLGVDINREGITDLATALDYMPLALVQAATYIRRRAPRCSVQQYLEEYRQSDGRKTSLLNQEAGHLRRDKAASNSVLITWQISFDYLRSTRPSAADLLSLMSFFDRQGIQEALLRSQSGATNENVSAIRVDDGFEDDILTLRDFSFITVTRNVNTFEMHSLVQLAMRTWLENQSQLDKWRERFISNLCAEFPTGEYENWEKCQILFPHVRAALTQKPKDEESLKGWALLLYNAAWYALRRGRADEAEYMAMASLKVTGEVYGEENAETFSSMEVVGQARALAGKYKEAESLNIQELEMSKKVLGADHLRTLVCMNNLATVLERQGKYEEVESMLRQTLVMCEKRLDAKHPHKLTYMNNLAFVLSRQGKYKEAEAMLRQTLATRKKVLGAEHPNTLLSMHNLALVLDVQGKYEEAETMHRQTLLMREKVLDAEHPDTLMGVYCLAHTLASQHRYDESDMLYKRACAGLTAALGEEHPTTRACHQHYLEMRSSQEQNRVAVPTKMRHKIRETGKRSGLLRGLAKMGIGRE